MKKLVVMLVALLMTVAANAKNFLIRHTPYTIITYKILNL